MGRPAKIEWNQLANGVHKITGSSHATIVVEMADQLIAIEGPLYEARTAPVVQAIKEQFADKPIRCVIPTHHHLDHAGGIRAFMATGATIVVPFSAKEFYTRVARVSAYPPARYLGAQWCGRSHRGVRRRSAYTDGRRTAR